MITTDEPNNYDPAGYPLYEKDDLDRRWDALLDKIHETHDQSSMDIETGVNALIDYGGVELLTEGPDLIRLLCQRQLRRLASRHLLDTESGRQHFRDTAVADLRAKPAAYAPVAARAGWPADPAALDDESLDAAHYVVNRPELLRGIPWEQFIDSWMT